MRRTFTCETFRELYPLDNLFYRIDTEQRYTRAQLFPAGPLPLRLWLGSHFFQRGQRFLRHNARPGATMGERVHRAHLKVSAWSRRPIRRPICESDGHGGILEVIAR
jgi:hypothetical protein